MKNVMRATLFVVLLVSLQISHAEVITNVSVPVNIPVFIPCAAGGAGELVVLSGDLHVLVRFTMSKSGGVHAAAHFQPQGISGIGQTTGEKYQGTGVTQDEFNARIGVEETFEQFSYHWASKRKQLFDP